MRVYGSCVAYHAQSRARTAWPVERSVWWGVCGFGVVPSAQHSTPLGPAFRRPAALVNRPPAWPAFRRPIPTVRVLTRCVGVAVFVEAFSSRVAK
eukprot:3625357-Lingulodinium_polyedra.AAC.1